MMQTSFKFNAYALVAVLVAVMFTSCSKRPQYAKLISEDAQVLMRFNVDAVASQLGSENSKAIADAAKKELQKSELSAEATQKIEEVVKDPAKAGIDFREPLVVSYGGKGNAKEEVRVLAAVHDKAALKDLLITTATDKDKKKFADKGNFTTYVDDDAVLVFNDEIFCATNTDGKAPATVDKLIALIEADTDKPKANAEELDKLFGSKSVAQVVITRKGMTEIETAAKTPLANGLKLSDLSMSIELDATEGALTWSYELQTYSEDWDKYLQKYDATAGAIGAEFLGDISKESFTMIGNINGKLVWDAIEESGVLNNLSKYTTDTEALKLIEKNLTSVNGDIVLTSHYANAADKVPSGFIYIKTTSDVMVKEVQQQIGKEAEAFDGGYKVALPAELMGGPKSILFGYKNSTTYATFGNDLKPFTKSASPIVADAKGKKFFLYCNFAFVKDVIEKLIGSNDKDITELAAKFDYAELSVTDTKKGEFKFMLKDKSQSPIALIAKALLDYATKEKPSPVPSDDTTDSASEVVPDSVA